MVYPTLNFVPGDDWEQELLLKDAAGAAIDYSGWTVLSAAIAWTKSELAATAVAVDMTGAGDGRLVLSLADTATDDPLTWFGGELTIKLADGAGIEKTVYYALMRAQKTLAARTAVALQPGTQGPIGINWRGNWATGTAYAIRDGVYEGGTSWRCIAAHTAGASTRPGSGASWQTAWAIVALGLDADAEAVATVAANISAILAAPEAASSAAGSATAASSSAAAAATSATAAAGSANAAAGSATAASGSAGAAATSTASAAGSATAASSSAAAAATSATAAAGSATAAAGSATASAGSATEAAASAAAAAAARLIEYAAYWYNDDESAIAAGGWPLTRRAMRAFTISDLFAEVTHGDPGDSLDVEIFVNGVSVYGPETVTFDTPLSEDALSIEIDAGDLVGLDTGNITGAPYGLWVQMSGV